MHAKFSQFYLRQITLISLLGWCLITQLVHADQVTSLTLKKDTKLDGLLFHEGTLYGAAGWDGSQIYEIHADGTRTSLGVIPKGPIDMVMDEQGSLIITSYGANAVYRLNRETGEKTVLTSLPSFAGSIVNYKPGEYLVGSAGRIYWVNDAGEVDIYFKDLDKIDNPSGLEIDNEHNVYIGNLAKATVLKLSADKETITEIAALPKDGQYNIGKLTLVGNNLYITHLSKQAIYKLSTVDNTLVQLTSPPKQTTELEGALDEVHFRSPNGMAFDNISNTLWIAPASGPTETLQLIHLDQL